MDEIRLDKTGTAWLASGGHTEPHCDHVILGSSDGYLINKRGGKDGVFRGLAHPCPENYIESCYKSDTIFEIPLVLVR